MSILFDLSFVREHIFMGISKYAYRILEYVRQIHQEKNFVLLVNSSSSEKLKVMFPEFETVVIGVGKINRIPKLGTIFLSYEFRRIVNEGDYDLVFCPWGNTISSLKVNKKKITVIHDFQFRQDTSGIQLKMRAFVDDRIVKYSDQIVTISEHSRQEILSYYPEVEKDLVSLGNVVSIPTDFSDKYVQSHYLLYVGRICKMKNTETLIRAYAEIANKIDHKLVIVGQNSNYWRNVVLPIILENKLNERVLLLEGIEECELNGLYKNADLFVFPSIREGFGFPPIEAAMLETPVICTKCDSLPEVTMGLLNYYENPLDYKELAANILKVLNTSPNPDKMRSIAEVYKKSYGVEVVSKRIYEYILENV